MAELGTSDRGTITVKCEGCGKVQDTGAEKKREAGRLIVEEFGWGTPLPKLKPILCPRCQ